MDAMRSEIIRETSASMKELIMTTQRQLMTDVHELIRASLEPVTQMLKDLTAQKRAAVLNITPDTNKTITKTTIDSEVAPGTPRNNE